MFDKFSANIKKITQSKLEQELTQAITDYVEKDNAPLVDYQKFATQAATKEKIGTADFKALYFKTMQEAIAKHLEDKTSAQLKTKVEGLLPDIYFTSDEKRKFFDILNVKEITNASILTQAQMQKITAAETKATIMGEINDTGVITKIHFEALIDAGFSQQDIIKIIKESAANKNTALKTYIETALVHKYPIDTASLKEDGFNIAPMLDEIFINAFAQGSQEFAKVFATFPMHLREVNEDGQYRLEPILKKLIDKDQDNQCTAFNNAIKALSATPKAHALLIATLEIADLPSYICTHIDHSGALLDTLKVKLATLDATYNELFDERNNIAEEAAKQLNTKSDNSIAQTAKQILIDEVNSTIDAKDAQLDRQGIILRSIDTTIKLCDKFKIATDVEAKIILKKQATDKITALQNDSKIPPELIQIQINALEETFNLGQQESLDATKKSALEKFSASIAILPRDLLLDVIDQTTKTLLKSNIQEINTAIIIGGFLNPLKGTFNKDTAGQNIATVGIIELFLKGELNDLPKNTPKTTTEMVDLLITLDVKTLQKLHKQYADVGADNTTLEEIAEKLLQKISSKQIENQIFAVTADTKKTPIDQCEEIKGLLDNSKLQNIIKQDIAKDVAEIFAKAMVNKKEIIPEYVNFIIIHHPSLLNDKFEKICAAPSKETPVPPQLTALLNIDYLDLTKKHELLNDYIGKLDLEAQLQVWQNLPEEHKQFVNVEKIKFSTLGLTEQLDTLMMINDSNIQKALLLQLNFEDSALQRIAQKITPEYFQNFFRLKEKSGEDLDKNLKSLQDSEKFSKCMQKMAKSEEQLDDKISFFSTLKSILYLISQSIFSGVLEKAGAKKHDISEARDQTEKLYALTIKLSPDIAQQAMANRAGMSRE